MLFNIIAQLSFGKYPTLCPYPGPSVAQGRGNSAMLSATLPGKHRKMRTPGNVAAGDDVVCVAGLRVPAVQAPEMWRDSRSP